MKTLDTAKPQIDRLVLAVIDKDEGTQTVNFRYLDEEEKKKLVEGVNEKNGNNE